MFILRILFTLAVIWFVFYAYRRFFKKGPQPKQITKKAEETKDIIRCQYCGLHVPAPEAIQKNGAYYCSQNHADL